ncbi:DUF4124 domain-containing protein [Psychrosphaera sp. B3R10]|uniref:DUF4124 domain-containing protein n=1 Tax=unclassified Psychrosphaera TaxID=2641570 RepID=UPI001C08667B|nr:MULTISPECIES: DUF4124 domain-containing protein [unclassified Psychrosphaera]MBU2880346.1 DUF4124 domain-containing protein [Psychrosphaera sp. I2R16]MBU2987785.1 DUF4124 domain-containing protein [Psychrosphaera sp. B3R10]MDO6720705.1 DUF4124 domain-containing protein [Psychrosphaera sp. 1_MG-2023]
MGKFVILLILVLISTNSLAADKKKIYVWRNAEGVLVFSDSPKPNVKSDTIDVSKTPNIIQSVDASIISGDTTKEDLLDVVSIDIVKPLDQDTIRDNTGSLYINGLIKPSFKRGMSVVLKFDDKKVAGPQKSAVFILRDVDRGEHRVQLEVWNDSGKVIAVSKPITVYLHRASVN